MMPSLARCTLTMVALMYRIQALWERDRRDLVELMVTRRLQSPKMRSTWALHRLGGLHAARGGVPGHAFSRRAPRTCTVVWPRPESETFQPCPTFDGAYWALCRSRARAPVLHRAPQGGRCRARERDQAEAPCERAIKHALRLQPVSSICGSTLRAGEAVLWGQVRAVVLRLPWLPASLQ